MDPMLDLARRFLAIEISLERNAWVDINKEITKVIDQIDDQKRRERKFNDRLLGLIWESRDVRAEEVLANVLYMKPEIAHKLCELKPELCPDFIHYLVDEARREWHEERTRTGWPPKRDVHELLKRHHYDVSDEFPEALELSLVKDPGFMLDLAVHLKSPLPFSLVLYKELEEVRLSRKHRLHKDQDARVARGIEDLYKTYGILERLPANDPRRRTYDSRSKTLTTELTEEIKKEKMTGGDSSQGRQNRATEENARDGPVEAKENLPGGYPPVQAEQEGLVGLALSGGGNRSATFNLGILQGLADLDLLRRLDYLSAVSGGSHIAGWLAAWVKREYDGVRRIQRWLSPGRNPRPDKQETQPIQFLRRFSNYLSPRKGFLSADSWAIFAMWLGNTFLNQIVFALLLASLLGVPKLVYRLFTHPMNVQDAIWMGGLSIVLLATVASLIGMNLNRFDYDPREGRGDRRRPSRLWEDFGVQSTVIIGFLVLGLLGSYQLFWMVAQSPPQQPPWLVTYFVLFLGLLTAQIWARTWRCFYTQRAEDTTPAQTAKAFLFTAASSAASSFLGWGVLYLSISFVVRSYSKQTPSFFGRGATVSAAATVDSLTAWLSAQNSYLAATVVVGPALLLTLLALVLTFQLGLMGRNLPDSRREWWSRLGATMLVTTGIWSAFSACALFGPWAVRAVGHWQLRQWQAGQWRLVLPLSFLLWLAITVIGFQWGRSGKTAPFPSESPEYTRGFQWASLIPRGWIAKIAPYVYIGGLALLLSFAVYEVSPLVMPKGDLSTDEHSQNVAPLNGSRWLSELSMRHWRDRAVLVGPSWLPFAMFALALVLAWRFDINEFSMHNLYRNRLVRCYLGASRANGARNPNPYTGFDPHDDLNISALRVQPPTPYDLAEAAPAYYGPLLIVNATLNLVAGKELAWQERKAASFAFTPLYSGYETEPGEARPRRNLANYGYRPTVDYSRPASNGLSLGTCIAISGAAANPNMGYHSSPALSFLMALFDVRLGYWLGNTRHRHTWKQSSPLAGLLYLINELIGRTDDTSRFINLSDGGHFENLGLYELVRRRCKYIIVSDAEEDANFSFNGLGNAIRKCRTDFGVDIRINPDHLRPVTDPGKELGRSRVHCAVGDIVYTPESRGKLLYIKSSLTGDEPGDVLEYKNRHSSFPHQSTIDQFFDESQFESYRALGQHIANVVLTGAVESWRPFIHTNAWTQGIQFLQNKLRAALAGNDDMGKHGAAAEAEENTTFLRELFRCLQAMWYPQTREMADLAQQHNKLYNQLVEGFEAVRDEELVHPARTFFRIKGDWRPQHEFFFYCRMIELIHRVFKDLELETTAEHPHHEGWMSMFRDWAMDDNFRETWSAVQANYDIQFQNFCRREFDLGASDRVRDRAAARHR